jgi:hypothetical protein
VISYGRTLTLNMLAYESYKNDKSFIEVQGKDNAIKVLNQIFDKIESDIKSKKMMMGGTTFQDKVDAISDRLEGEKVPKRLEKDYGKTYNKEESIEAAQRIAGAMRKKYKN